MQASLAHPDAPPAVRRPLAGLRALYGASVGVLVLLAATTAASPLILPALSKGRQTTQATDVVATRPAPGSRLQIAAQPGEWVLQYNLVNDTTDSGSYRFELAADGSVLSTADVVVPASGPYVYIYHLHPDQVPGGEAQLTVRRSGVQAPVDDVTLNLAAVSPAGQKAR